MRCVVQRVSRAEVRVEGAVVGRVGTGMMILLGVLRGDGPTEAVRLAEKVARFRFFPDERGRMNRSALDLLEAGEAAGALVVSQFTLAADGRRGRRPSFDRASDPEVAEPLVDQFVARLREFGIPTETGRFGASMQVNLSNEGPVTFVLEDPLPPNPA